MVSGKHIVTYPVSLPCPEVQQHNTYSDLPGITTVARGPTIRPPPMVVGV